MTDNTVITPHDIQLRFVSHSSNKIIINTNANFQIGDEKYSEDIQIRNAELLKQQLISDHKTVEMLKEEKEKILKEKCWRCSGTLKDENGYECVDCVNGINGYAQLDFINRMLGAQS